MWSLYLPSDKEGPVSPPASPLYKYSIIFHVPILQFGTATLSWLTKGHCRGKSQQLSVLLAIKLPVIKDIYQRTLPPSVTEMPPRLIFSFLHPRTVNLSCLYNNMLQSPL